MNKRQKYRGKRKRGKGKEEEEIEEGAGRKTKQKETSNGNQKGKRERRKGGKQTKAREANTGERICNFYFKIHITILTCENHKSTLP